MSELKWGLPPRSQSNTNIPANPSRHVKNSLEDVHAAIAALQAAGFENYSVDLIGGLPGQVRYEVDPGYRSMIPVYASVSDISPL